MHVLILCPVWLLFGTFPALAWSWTRDGFIDSVLSEYGKFDQAARADTVKDGIITETEFINSLYRQADLNGNNDNKISRDEFLDYYNQRFNISSELGTVMFDILNDPKSNDDIITSADVSLSSFSGRNYATIAEFREGLEKWLKQSADKLYSILMSSHVMDTRREPEIRYNIIINSMDANNDDVISTEELNDELKRINPSQSVRRRDWVWRNTQRYGADPVTANLVFDYWDRDRDLELTPRDLKYLADDMDLNGNNKVEKNELLRFVERGYKLSKRMTASPLSVTMIQCPDPWWISMGWSPNIDAHRAAMDFDDDLNGWITLADLRRWLNVFDDDDDGSISRREHSIFHSDRYGVNSTVASAMFDMSDINGDDKLDEQDWEFHFKDGFSLSFCDARRSILDLARMAEKFRGIRQGRELRDSMQRLLQEEWSWYLQNKPQGSSSDWYRSNGYNEDSANRNQDLCGNRLTCYVGEYTEDVGQPGAWLWWGLKGHSRRPGGVQTQFDGELGGASLPMGGFSSPVSGVSNQMGRFIGPVGQIGGVSRPIPVLPNPPILSNSPMFDLYPWADVANIGPIGGMGPFPRFKRATENGGNKSQSEKSVKNNHYFNTYHRLFSPFSESESEPTPTPSKPVDDIITQPQSSPDQHQNPAKQPSDVADQAEFTSLEEPRIRTPSSINDQPTTKSKTENDQETENQQTNPNWPPSQLPVWGYPVMIGFDPWMFGGIPNWGMFGRKRREHDFKHKYDLASEEQMRVKRQAENVDSEDEMTFTEDSNRTVERDDSVNWTPLMPRPPPPGFGIMPWDFWMVWSFENAMWDTMRLLDELKNMNISDVDNGTNTTDSQQWLRDNFEWLDKNTHGEDDVNVTEDDAMERERRSNDDIAQEESADSIINSEGRDKRFAQRLGSIYSLYWPLIFNRWRRQYVPISARYWPPMIPNTYSRFWNNGEGIGSYSNPWTNPLLYQNPWFARDGNWNLWRSMLGSNRFKRNAEEDSIETTGKDGEREQRSKQEETPRRDSSQARDSTSEDKIDSVWRSASRKYANKGNWEQQLNTGSPQWNLGKNERYDYTTSRWTNENLPNPARPTQPGWLKNIISGTRDSWKDLQPGYYRNPWETTYGQPYSLSNGNMLQRNMWNNVIPRTLLSSFATPGSAWPDWTGPFDGSFGYDGGQRYPFGNMDQWSNFPGWPGQWQDSFDGIPRNWLALRDTDRNLKEFDNLWKMWYGRFSRETQYNKSAENKSEVENNEDKQEIRQKRDVYSDEGARKRRWDNGYSGMFNPLSSFQTFPSWISWFFDPWCQSYWRSLRYARSTAEYGGIKSENITKRRDATEPDKDKRWNEWNKNQQGYTTDRMPTFWDTVCFQGDIRNPSENVMHSYQQFRKKRGTSIYPGAQPVTSLPDGSRERRWEQWMNWYGDDYDCVEWISAMSAWTPWKGWNLLRSTRESAKFDNDSNDDKTESTKIRSYNDQDNRAVRCRLWYRKYRHNNSRKDRDDSSKDNNQDVVNEHSDLSSDSDLLGQEYKKDDSQTEDKVYSHLREKREIAREDWLKRQEQMNYQSPWMYPFSSTSSWNRRLYPHDSQNWMSQLKPQMHSSLGYYNRWNNPFKTVRELRASENSADESDRTAPQRQKRATEDSKISKRFWSRNPSLYGLGWAGQNIWNDNDNRWGWQMEPYNNRPQKYYPFTDYRASHFDRFMADRLRQQRSLQDSDIKSTEGKQALNDDGISREKRAINEWVGYPHSESLRSESLQPSLSDYRQHSYPDSWNTNNWALKRNIRSANTEAQEVDKEKRFAIWDNFTPNMWNWWMQQLLRPTDNLWTSQLYDPYNGWRYLRDTDNESINARQKREVLEKYRTARSPLFYPVPFQNSWDNSWRSGTSEPSYYNYWRMWLQMYFNGWDKPNYFWNSPRFLRDSNDNKLDIRDTVNENVDRTKNETAKLSRGKRWSNARHFLELLNHNGNDNGNVSPWDGRSEMFHGMHLNPLESTNYWNTGRLIRDSNVQKDVERNKRSLDDSSKAKRWDEQLGSLQSTISKWWQPYLSNYGQSWNRYTSNYQRPIMSPSYLQSESDWSRSGGYPWSDSWQAQLGPFSRHQSLGVNAIPLDNIWGFDRFPRGSEDKGERTKRDAENDTRNKRWQDFQFPLNNFMNSYTPNNFKENEWMTNENLWRKNMLDSLRYSWQSKQGRLKRNVQEKTIDKRWQMNEQHQWPVNTQWNPYDLNKNGNNQWTASSNWWGNGGDIDVRYPRNSLGESKMVTKRNAETFNSKRHWQGRDLFPWTIVPHYTSSDGWSRDMLNAPSPFSNQESSIWSLPRRLRHAETEEASKRNKRDSETNSRTKRWQDNDWFLWTNHMNRSPMSTGLDKSSTNWSPYAKWGREYSNEFPRYARDSADTETQYRHKRETDKDDRTKRWQGTDWPAPGDWLQRAQNPYSSVYNSGNEWESGRQLFLSPWSNRNMWSQLRYQRDAQDEIMSQRNKRNVDLSKSKRQGSRIFPFFGRSSQSQWNPQGQDSYWSRDLDTSSTFGSYPWMSRQDGYSNQWTWPRGSSVWRYPRQTSDSKAEDAANGKKPKTDDSSRDKRWQNWNSNPLLDMDNWSYDVPQGIPWYYMPFWNPSYNSNSFFKRDTEESKKSAGHSLDEDDKERAKRWQTWSSIPVNYEDSNYPLLYKSPQWSYGFFSGWNNPLASTLRPTFGRYDRQAQSTENTTINDRSKRSSVEVTQEKRSIDGNSSPNIDWNSQSNRIGFLENKNTNPWFSGDQFWTNREHSYRYPRNTDDVSEHIKGNKESDSRSKRQNYWSNTFGNNWNNNWWNGKLGSWLSNGMLPYNTMFFLPPFMNYRFPYMGISGFWNRFMNQSPARYFRNTATMLKLAKRDANDTREKRWHNFGMMDQNYLNSYDYFNQIWSNPYMFSNVKGLNPYFRAFNSISDERFYRDTDERNSNIENERTQSQTENGSAGKESESNFSDQESAQGRQKRDTGSEDKRQRRWLPLDENPIGYDSFGKFRISYPYDDSSILFGNPALRNQNVYTSWNPLGRWSSGMAHTKHGFLRDLRETQNDLGENQKREKRETWDNGFNKNWHGYGTSYGGNINNPLYDRRNQMYPWSADYRQSWDTQSTPTIQWRGYPSYPSDRRSASYSPIYSKRNSDNGEQNTDNKENTRIKRNVEESNRKKRWWRYNDSPRINPQYGMRAGGENILLNPWESYNRYPQHSIQLWSNERKRIPYRRKRESKVEASQNKRWAQFDRARSHEFSRYGPGYPITDPFRSSILYPRYDNQNFSPLQNTGNQRWGGLRHQDGPFWRGHMNAISYRRKRLASDTDRKKRMDYMSWYSSDTSQPWGQSFGNRNQPFPNSWNPFTSYYNRNNDLNPGGVSFGDWTSILRSPRGVAKDAENSVHL